MSTKKNIATANRIFTAFKTIDEVGNRRQPSPELKCYIGSPEWKAAHGYDQPKAKKDERKATWAFISKHILK